MEDYSSSLRKVMLVIPEAALSRVMFSSLWTFVR